MWALITLYSVCLVFGVAFLIWMHTKAGKEWLKNL